MKFCNRFGGCTSYCQGESCAGHLDGGARRPGPGGGRRPPRATFASLLCGDLPLADTFPDLSVEGPAWIRAHLQVDPTPRDWAVGGLSCGGIRCLQLAVNAPPVYPGFLDFAGQDEPTFGDRASTVNAAVRGHAIVFAPVSPLDVVKGQRLSATAGVISAGRDDVEYGPLARRVVAASTAAGTEHPPAARWAHLGGVGRGTRRLGAFSLASRSVLTL